MKWFYNLKFNRIFCVLTACFVLFLGCFGVFKFIPKNEPIQASAYSLDKVNTSPQYFLKLGAGTSFSLGNSTYEPDTHIIGQFNLTSSIFNATFSSFFTLLPDSFYSELNDSVPYIAFFNYVSSNNTVVISRDFYIYIGPISGGSISITYYNFDAYDFSWGYGDDVSIPLTYFSRSWGSGASAEDIARAEQEGFEDGLGVAYSHVASKSIFECSRAFAYDYGGNLLSDITLTFEPLFTGANNRFNPIYKLVANGSLPNGFEVRISLQPFLDYTRNGSGQPLDYICINNQGLTSSVANNLSIYFNIRGYCYVDRDSSLNNMYSMDIGTFNQGATDLIDNFSSFTFRNPPPRTHYLTELRFYVDDSALRSNVIGLFSTSRALQQYNEFFYDGEVYGYNNGYDVGYNDGEDYGLDIGYDSGYDSGYISGFGQGESSGKIAGYSEGLAEGLASAELGSFTNLFTAAIDAPIKAFLGLLDFEILGQDMQVLFLSLLTGALVIAAFRLFSGGT